MKNALQGLDHVKAFRDKYLAAVMMVAALLISTLATSQVDTTKVRQRINAYGYEWKNGTMDSSFRIPRDTFRLRQADTGSIAIKRNVLYIWSQQSGVLRWDSVRAIGTGSSSGSADSTIFATLYRVDTAKINLRTSIAGKAGQQALEDTATAIRADFPVTDSTIFSTNYRRDTAINNIRTAKWPAESTLGAIYYKTNWDRLTDFTINTTGGATTSLALSSGFINYSVSTIDWDNWTTILSHRPTIMNRWKVELVFEQITTPAANTTGFGITMHRAITQNNDIACYINTTSGGSSGTLTIARGDGSATYKTQAGQPVSVNDNVYLGLEMKNDSTVDFTSYNITDDPGAANLTTNSFSFPIGSSTQRIPTIANFGLIGHSGVACTWRIKWIRITSNFITNANGYVFGDSKSQFNTPSSYQSRTANKLNGVYPSFVTYAAGGATIADFLNLQEEWTSFNGRQYLIHLGSNDKRGGATDQQVIDRAIALDRILTGGGAKVCWTLAPEDSTAGGVGLTAIKNGMAATFSSRWINIWDTLSTSNVLQGGFNAGDGVHWNQAAIDAAHVRIVNSGCLTTAPTNRITIYARGDNNTKRSGDSVYTMPVEKASGYTNYYDNKGSSLPGVIQQTATQAGASALGPITYITNALFQVVGIHAISGTTGGVSWADRSGSQTAFAFSAYVDGTFRIFNNTTATDRFTLTSGGLASLGRGSSSGTAWLHFGAGTAAIPVMKFTRSGAAVPSSPTDGDFAVDANGLMYYVPTTAIGLQRVPYFNNTSVTAGAMLQGNSTTNGFTLTALGTANQLWRVNAGGTAGEWFTHSFATLAGSETLTNKILTSPQLNSSVTMNSIRQLTTASYILAKGTDSIVTELTPANAAALMGFSTGNYTATINNPSNCGSFTVFNTKYQRVLNTVYMSGKITYTPSSAGHSFQITLPSGLTSAFSGGSADAQGGAGILSGTNGAQFDVSCDGIDDISITVQNSATSSQTIWWFVIYTIN